MTMRVLLLVVAVFSLSSAVRGDVVDRAANGFTVKTTVTIAAPPERVYGVLVRVGDWWDSAHTWSGSARNLRLDPRAGGCWCETLPGGGSVQHAVVVHADPGKLLRLQGTLGPLQASGLAGTLTWELQPAGMCTTATDTYAVGGYVAAGVDSLAVPVDGDLSDQLRRLKMFVERTAAVTPQ
jgi:uncharacterized protein YndB with AHSA1/START domain